MTISELTMGRPFSLCWQSVVQQNFPLNKHWVWDTGILFFIDWLCKFYYFPLPLLFKYKKNALKIYYVINTCEEGWLGETFFCIKNRKKNKSLDNGFVIVLKIKVKFSVCCCCDTHHSEKRFIERWDN